MKLGRFIVETHCHGQRTAARMKGDDHGGDIGNMYDKLLTAVPADESDDEDEVIVYDNSDRLMYDMEEYGVDMCVLLPGQGMNNEINHQIIQQYPDKFVSGTLPIKTMKKQFRGEAEWNWEEAIAEMDHWLSKDGFVLIGEGCPPRYGSGEHDGNPTWAQEKEELRKVFDLAAQHDVPVSLHPMPGHSNEPTNKDPTLAGEIKAEYPEVPIIFNHGGMPLWWGETRVDQCCQVAASWDNVYLEVGLYWADLLKKPYNDPNIGPEQMLWGGDWGASISGQVSRPEQYPPFYWDFIDDRGITAHQPDYWGASFRQLLKFAMEEEVEQDKLNLILGGNAARLFDLEVPHSRMFENYLQT